VSLELSSFGLLVLLIFALAGVFLIFLLARDLRRMTRQRDALLQEKDVVFTFVQDVGEVFAGTDSVDLSELLRRVLFYALRTTHAGSGALYLMEDNGEVLRAHALSGIFPPLAGGLDAGFEKAFSKTRHIEDLVRSQEARFGRGLIGEVAATEKAVLVRDAEQDTRIPQFDVDFLHVHSALAVPMRFRNRVLGVLVVVNRVDERPFIQADQNLLQALADQASVSVYYAKFSAALDEKRRLDYDLGIAHRIQMTLLPKEVPALPGVEVAAFSVPAQQIGGDYYDFVKIDDNHLGIAIADVSGKGVSGAMVMALCRSALRIKAPGCLSPAAVLRAMHAILTPDLAEDMYVTMLYMILDPVRRELRVARAGHVSPILHPGNRAQPLILDAGGLAIGLGDEATFGAALEERLVNLNPGDMVVAYTDGVTEAMDGAGNEWGILNFVKTIQLTGIDTDEQGAQGLIKTVHQKLMQYVGETAQYDDMTLVALRIV
jgi:sigma-B regulation protein RsbU (phosphoserine phosphatase)